MSERICICWWCEKPATVEMTLAVNPPRREWFCETDAKKFDLCWQRVELQADEQLTFAV